MDAHGRWTTLPQKTSSSLAGNGLKAAQTGRGEVQGMRERLRVQGFGTGEVYGLMVRKFSFFLRAGSKGFVQKGNCCGWVGWVGGLMY